MYFWNNSPSIAGKMVNNNNLMPWIGFIDWNQTVTCISVNFPSETWTQLFNVPQCFIYTMLLQADVAHQLTMFLSHSWFLYSCLLSAPPSRHAFKQGRHEPMISSCIGQPLTLPPRPTPLPLPCRHTSIKTTLDKWVNHTKSNWGVFISILGSNYSPADSQEAITNC